MNKIERGTLEQLEMFIQTSNYRRLMPLLQDTLTCIASNPETYTDEFKAKIKGVANIMATILERVTN